MTVMSEGLSLNSKYIKTGREKGGFEVFLTQPPLAMRLCIYSFATVRRAYKGHMA